MMDPQQLIYLYDLPKDKITCTMISLIFKEKSGVILDSKPQIKRDLTRPFCSAMVSIKDTKQFNEACEKMRYFEIEGKQCRALPFDKQLLGSNKDKLLNHNIFVKVPKHLKHEDLHNLFENFGKIKSLKISLNPDFSSRGYGFICFQEENSANGALQGGFPDGVVPMKFEPKDRRSFRRLINNIYVKNIPEDKSNEDITDLFKPFGHIKSLFVQQHEFGKFAFICYDDPTGQNKEYGPQCAQKAIDELNDQEIAPGIKLCVKHALKKAERDIEKIRDTIRYKASKKRCNLYVKNFPNSYTKEELMNLFKTYGEIENIRLEQGPSTKNAFAFVCYKEPTDAAKAKQNLQNHHIEGKMLMINYYEIKEVRKLQMEEARDKADWEKYQAQLSGGLKWNDLTSQPHLAQMLQQLLGIIQINEQANQAFQSDLNNRQQRGRNPNYRGPRQQHMGYNQGMGNMHQGNPGMGQQQQQQMHPGMGQQMGNMPPQQRMVQQQQQQQQPMPQQQQQQQPQMPQAPGGGMPMMPNPNQMMGMNPNSMPIQQRYLHSTNKYIPALNPNNPHLKTQVGGCIYEYVQMIVGDDKAPKITGMLIELPVNQIREYMMDWNNLNMKVKEALEHWENAQKDSMQHQ